MRRLTDDEIVDTRHRGVLRDHMKWYYKMRAALPPLPNRVCAQCDNEFVVARTRGKTSSFCSGRCRERHRNARRVRPQPIMLSGNCHECSGVFECEQLGSGPHKKYCTDKCQVKARRRRAEHNRRARMRSAFVESVDPMEISKRDGWRCQLCYKAVNRKVAAPHPLAPTLDHIIPLAKGGTHEPKNVQLAHFLCNSTKRDQVGGQLRFLG